MSIPDPQCEHYTYADYLKWPENERWELIEGRAYDMTPAPLTAHQRISARLTALLINYFEGKPCQVFAAPFDVRLPRDLADSDDQIDTVVQPDLVVICDQAKLDRRGLKGAPDLAIEILSESTSGKDMNEKLALYEKHKVRCYLIVDPWGKTITARYLNSNNKWGRAELFSAEDQMPVRIFEGLAIDLSRLFSE